MALGEDARRPEKRDHRQGHYEHPALKPEAGSSSWSERWARFKRLFVAMAWHNVETRARLFLGIAFMVIGIIIGVFEKF